MTEQLSIRYFRDMFVDVMGGVVLRYRDGTFPTADELDQLKASAYIYDSLYQSTLRAIAADSLKPRCPTCNHLL